MTRDLHCGETCVPDVIDDRVVANLRQRHRFTLNDDFLAQMTASHGGRPQIATFMASGESWRIGQFLTLLDGRSELVLPFRPHFDHCSCDERAIESVPHLVDGDNSTSRALFKGLMPFATTVTGMCFDRAYVNLLCLNHRVSSDQPTVVMWLAEQANEAYMDWEDSFEFGDDEEDVFQSVPWDTFLIPVADSFDAFIQSLR